MSDYQYTNELERTVKEILTKISKSKTKQEERLGKMDEEIGRIVNQIKEQTNALKVADLEEKTSEADKIQENIFKLQNDVEIKNKKKKWMKETFESDNAVDSKDIQRLKRIAVKTQKEIDEANRKKGTRMTEIDEEIFKLRREHEQLTQEYRTNLRYEGYTVIGKLEPLRDYILPEAKNIHIYEWRMTEWQKWLKKS